MSFKKVIKKVTKYADKHGEKMESSALFGKGGVAERFKKTRDLSNRTSNAFPKDTIGQHIKRVKKIGAIHKMIDIENSTSKRPVQPTPKKPNPTANYKREKLL